MCGNDLLALGVLQELRRRKLRVPADVAVTGFNNFDFAEFVDPPLTTVRTPGYEMGRAAAQNLIDALEGTGPVEAGSSSRSSSCCANPPDQRPSSMPNGVGALPSSGGWRARYCSSAARCSSSSDISAKRPTR